MMYFVKKSRTLLTGVDGKAGVELVKASVLVVEGREVEGMSELSAARGSFLGEIGDLCRRDGF